MTEWFFLVGGFIAGGILAAILYRKSTSRKPGRIETPALDHETPVEIQPRMDTLQKLNRILVEAHDEQHLISALLELMLGATHTAGATYIPLDELGEPLAQIHRGVVPQYPYQTWTAHLTQPDVQEICRACQNLHKETRAACPLAGNPFVPDGEITCLALQRGGRRLGLINLYHHPGQSLSADEVSFIRDILDETSLAVDNLRLHNQEVATLKQLQMVHRSTDETSALFTQLVDSIWTAIDCDLAILYFTANRPSRPAVTRSRLSAPWQELPALREIVSRVQNTSAAIRLVGEDASTSLPGFQSVLVVPVQVSGHLPVGCFVTARVDPSEFTSREQRIIEVVAAQAAMVDENERKVLELEYKAVIEERTRLAREIHDGLAQTLAFLKMQAAQMNGLLQRGETGRLAEMLRTNQQILGDAYTETRQAINHLRLSPQPGIRSWLVEAVKDFRQISKIDVVTSLEQDPHSLPVEIQSQLIRILQEALNNIRKHSQARKVWISFHAYQGDLVLEIHDDGRGFLPEDIPTLSQYGLQGMRERAEMIGADFQIISQPGNGTTVRLQLPFAYTQEAQG